MTQRSWIGGFFPLALIVGCGSGGAPPPQAYPVSGKVLLGDVPASGGVITFHPKDPPANEALGYIGKDGTFKVGTFGKDDGALPGRYVVTVEPLSNKAPGGKGTLASGRNIPRRYWSANTSGLSVEIKAEQNVLRPFVLR